MSEPAAGHNDNIPGAIDPSIFEYADRIIALETKLDELRDEQIDLMLEVGCIHWTGGWTGKDGRRLPNPMERFVRIVDFDAENGCWNWPKHRVTNSGYGLFGFDGNSVLAHRWSMAFTKGLVHQADDGTPLVVDHLCKNKRCVNPFHLEEVTQSTNVKRGVVPKIAVTHCRRGHLMDGANSYYWKNQRACRACGAARKLAWQRKNRDGK